MGLREVKVERTRAQIVAAAQDLFLEHGYAETTMEQVAEAAEVGTSTLYRYFPSKDLLLLESLVQSIALGRHLESRPADEPLEESLGAVIRAAYPPGDLDHDSFLALRRMVDAEPGPRARMWELVDHAVRDLEQGIAQRLGRAVGDPTVYFAARNALVVYDLVGRRWSGRTPRSWEQAVDRTLEALDDVEIVLPR